MSTKIEWVRNRDGTQGETINPFRARNKATGAIGHFCEKVGPGCKNCYASRLQCRFGLFPFVAENRDKVELFLDESKLQEVLRRRKPTTWFWCDMTDMFWDGYPDEWRDRCFAVMALTPQHMHIVFTKRAGEMRDYLSNEHRLRMKVTLGPLPLPNVWLGVSVEDRKNKDRIELLRQAPAAIRFLSLEPLLEDIGMLDLTGIHWVICGGESGPGARPAPPDWFRSARDQCQAAGVPFFFKHWGEWSPVGDAKRHVCRDVPIGDGTHHRMFRVGGKNAGRLLDRRTWDEMPEARQ